MADIIALTAVINKTVEITANLILEESSQLYWLRVDIPWLQDQMRHMRSYIIDAENKQATDSRTVSLLKQIKVLSEDVEDILDTFLPKIESHKSRGSIKRAAHILSYGRTCRKFANQIQEIKRRVDAIDIDRKIYRVEDSAVATNELLVVDPRPVALYSDEPIVIGFDKDINELKAKLLSDNDGVVSIVGMPGLGKTTLAKKVFKCVRDEFECSASVSISQTPNVKAILEDIAKQVGLEKEKREENVEENLYSFLQERRYVLFLDDIWHNQSWDGLKLGFPVDIQCGSKIIITSRHTSVGRYIGGIMSLHELKPFDFETSWELFSKLIVPWMSTNSQCLNDSELESVGKMIVQRCGGVPLAIALSVGMLREREMSEMAWRDVLKSMGRDAHDECSQILALSYKDLPSPLKPCFLYLGLFPEDFEIKASELIRMWVGENFLKGDKDFEPEDVGYEYIDKLVARNLVQVASRKFDGKVNSFLVHDLLHSLCINLSKESNFFHTSLDHMETDLIRRVRRLSTHKENILLNSLTSKLRTLFVIELDDTPPHIFAFELMRVLSVQADYYSVPKSPSIRNLKQLSYLKIHVESVDFELPSHICDLKHLETLDVQGVDTSFLVLAGIFKMKKLRHLLLQIEIYRDRQVCQVCPNALQLYLVQKPIEVCLPNLRTLSLWNSLDLKPMRLHTSPHLRKLVLSFPERETVKVLSESEPFLTKLEKVFLFLNSGNASLLNLSPYHNLLNLKLRFYGGDGPTLFDHFPPNLLKLALHNTSTKKSMIDQLKKLSKLKILILGLHDYDSETTLDCSGVGSFPRLEVLQLQQSPSLTELIVDEDGSGMPKLRQIITKGCRKLVALPESLQRRIHWTKE